MDARACYMSGVYDGWRVLAETKKKETRTLAAPARLNGRLTAGRQGYLGYATTFTLVVL